jgi:hypothetical protein
MIKWGLIGLNNSDIMGIWELMVMEAMGKVTGKWGGNFEG